MTVQRSFSVVALTVLLLGAPATAQQFEALVVNRLAAELDQYADNRQRICIADDVVFEDSRDESIKTISAELREAISKSLHKKRTGLGSNTYEVVDCSENPELKISYIHVRRDHDVDKVIVSMDVDAWDKDNRQWVRIPQLKFHLNPELKSAPSAESRFVIPAPKTADILEDVKNERNTARVPPPTNGGEPGGFGVRILVGDEEQALFPSSKIPGLYEIKGLKDGDEFSIQLVNSYQLPGVFAAARVTLDGRPHFTNQAGEAMLDSVPGPSGGSAGTTTLVGFGKQGDRNAFRFTLKQISGSASHHNIEVQFRFAAETRAALQAVEPASGRQRKLSIEPGRQVPAATKVQRAFIGSVRETIRIVFTE